MCIKVLFLDRDGVINRDIGYCHRIQDFNFIDGIFEICADAVKKGFYIIIVTNQSGIARGYYSSAEFIFLNNWMLEEFKKKSINILDTYFCPHGPEDSCECRKPEPGLLIQAIREHKIDVKNSWLVGDKETDIEAAIKAGLRKTILLSNQPQNDKKTTRATIVIRSLDEIKRIIV